MNITNNNSLNKNRATGWLLVFVLLFNIVFSAVVAGYSDDGQYAWLCTSQGLIKVALDADPSNTNDASINTQPSSEPCPYCQLFDLSTDLADSQLAYPHPELPLASLYRAPQTAMSLRPILSALSLRAPPSFSLL